LRAAERAGRAAASARKRAVDPRYKRPLTAASPPPSPAPPRVAPFRASPRRPLSPLRSAPPFLRTRSDIHVRGRVFYLFDPLGAAEQWREAILAAKAELLMGGSAGPA
jgi:hypothetical protein